MSEIQKYFNKLVDLIIKMKSENSILNDCLDQIDQELSFSYHSDNNENNKDQIIDVYKRRASMEMASKSEEPFVVGYDNLMPNLINTKISDINISDISNKHCTYIFFTDNDYNEFIGVLKSKRNLIEIRGKMKNSGYYSENIFINKQLIENAL